MGLNIIFLILGVAGVIVGSLALQEPILKYGLIVISGVIGLIGFALIVRDWWDSSRGGYPHLEATLVIDTLDVNQPNFHIEFQNAEGPQVTLTRYAYKNKAFADAVDLPPAMRPIIPSAAKISIPGKLYSGITKTPADLEVNAAYEISSDPTTKFHSTYRFFVDHPVKPNDRFNAVNWQESAGDFDASSSLIERLIVGFAQPLGTITFVFPEKKPDGTPNILDVKNQYRRITADPITMTVRFVSQFPPSSKSKSIETDLKQNEKGMHNLIATWNDKNQTISLMVDGQQNQK
jgi:hypothetical protein